jgi:dTDP-4-dehydrorhamnose reductase
MMKILLLGANGQLGSDIFRKNLMRDNPMEIIAWQRHNLDITNKEELQKKLKEQPFDVLLNCTSYHNTDHAEKTADMAFLINAFCVKEMAQICKEKNARFVHISTDYVFSHHPDNQPLTELDIPSPLNVYGASKLMGESLAESAHDDTLIFRVASLFGIMGASGKGGNFVETMLRIGREKGKLRVISDQTMSPTSTASIAEVILKAIHMQIPSGVYHTVNSGTASWYEFAKEIIQHAGVNANVEPMLAADYPSVAVRPSFSALNNNKLAKLVGPIPSWQSALDSYLREKGHIN